MARYKGHIQYIHHAPMPSPQANCLQVLQMCSAFARTGGQVELILPALTAEPSRLFDGVGNGSVAVRSMNCRVNGRLGVLLYSWRAAARAVASGECVFYTRSIYAAIAGCLHRLPVFWEVHTPADTCASRGWALKRRVLCGRHGVRGVVAISDRMARKLAGADVPQDRILVAHDSADIERFSPSAYDRNATRASLKYGRDTRLAVYAGKFDACRGVLDIIEAARSLPEVSFLLVGAPSGQVERMQASAPANVRILGYRPHAEIPALLAAADVLLSPHRSSTNIIDVCSPLKLFEYMAMEKPIILSDFPVFHEILEPGKEAFYFRPDDVGDLVNVLKKVFSDLPHANRVAAVAAAKVRNNSWMTRAQAIREFIGRRLDAGEDRLRL